MKKLIVLSAMLAFTLVSCDKEDDKPVTQPEDNTKTLLIGKWNMIKGEVYKAGKLVETVEISSEECDYDYYEIKVGGIKDEVYHEPEDNCSTYNYEGTWAYNSANKHINLVDAEDGYLLEGEIIEISATNLKFKIISDGGIKPEDQGLELFYYLEK